MTTDEHLNLARWSEAIYKQQQQFQAQVLKELARMSADLSALQAAVAKIGADVDSALAALATAKANEADPAVLTHAVESLDAASAKITSALNPPAA